MIATAIGSVLATLSVCFGIGGGVALYFVRRTARPAAVEQRSNPFERDPNDGLMATLQDFGIRLATVETLAKGLPSLWEEERERARKHADRAAAAYRGAEEVLSAISGEDEDEEEGADLRGFDGEGGGELPGLFGDVAGSRERAEAETALRAKARRHLAALG